MKKTQKKTNTHTIYNINDVADYVIIQAKGDDEKTPLSNLKLQKILYYIQAWSYGIHKRPFFKGNFQAWIHGPVNREIYDRFSTKFIYDEINLKDCKNKSPQIKNKDLIFLNFILNNYLQYSGFDLESMTHKERPWKEARGDRKFTDRCENIITEKSMIDFYGKKWANIQAKDS